VSRRSALLLVAAAMLALPPRSGAQPAAAAAAQLTPASIPSLAYDKYGLANGLEVILHQDRSLPLVAVNIWYHVGPAHEPAGRSGFAHLFEHLMYQGSKHVGRRFDRLLESAGATNANGTTSWDRTNYFVTVPREHLELVLWLESDRMGFLLDSLTQRSLDLQREVVKNERRESFDNAPYGPSTLTLLNTLFPKQHPYHGAIIGSLADLSAASLQDARAFFRSYYAPSNATLAIVGDFDRSRAARLVWRYFGTLPSKPPPPHRRQVTPPLRNSQRIVVEEPVQLGKVSIGWITPPAYSKADLPLDLAMLILAEGKATRLYRALVVEQQLASEVAASLDSNELCSMALIEAMAKAGTPIERVEQALDQELADLAASGPTPGELARAKRRRLVGLLNDLQPLNGGAGESGRAGILQRFNHYLGDPGYLKTYVARVQRVYAAEVRRAVRRYLRPEARVVVITQPAGAGAEAAPAGATK
jgi:zinc protease